MAEDEPIQRDLLQQNLTNEGYQVLIAADGQEALDKVRAENPDLVLLDVRMPKLDGYTVCERIKKENPGNFVPVILVTAYAGSTEEKAKCLDQGADDLLEKPYDPVELVARVRAQLRTRKLYERAQYLATHDAMTDTCNRHYLMEQLETELERFKRYGTPFSLALVDIDKFKHLNDTSGHLSGDAALIKLASVLKQAVRQDIDIVARYGGDEFAVLFPHSGKGEAEKICDRFVNLVRATPFELPGSKKKGLTVSVGLAVVPDDAKETEELIKMADTALYKAKQAGRNRLTVARKTPSRKN